MDQQRGRELGARCTSPLRPNVITRRLGREIRTCALARGMPLFGKEKDAKREYFGLLLVSHSTLPELIRSVSERQRFLAPTLLSMRGPVGGHIYTAIPCQ